MEPSSTARTSPTRPWQPAQETDHLSINPTTAKVLVTSVPGRASPKEKRGVTVKVTVTLTFLHRLQPASFAPVWPSPRQRFVVFDLETSSRRPADRAKKASGQGFCGTHPVQSGQLDWHTQSRIRPSMKTRTGLILARVPTNTAASRFRATAETSFQVLISAAIGHLIMSRVMDRIRCR